MQVQLCVDQLVICSIVVKQLAHRNLVIAEILSTERTYISCLRVLVEVFYEPLLSFQRVGAVEMTADEATTVHLSCVSVMTLIADVDIWCDSSPATIAFFLSASADG